MFTTISQADAQEMMMKPLHITAVVNELIALESANVISSNTVSDVVNLIFQDIRDSTQTLRDDWNNLVLTIKDQSEYLYRTVGELNEMAGDYVSPYDDMATYQIFVDRVNNVYTKVKEGFEAAGDMTTQLNGVRSGTGGSSTRGVFMGGGDSYITNCSFITFATTGNSIEFGELTTGKSYSNAVSDRITCMMAGGQLAPGGAITCLIGSLRVATGGTAVNRGD